ncbi:MAG: hypothetical protein U9N81_01370 [Bacillota bacterium]|nr:hypothetical protein [Bacillota bacterium]
MRHNQTLSVLALLFLVISFCAGCGNQDPVADQSDPPADKLSIADFISHTPGNYRDYEGEGNEYAAFNTEVLYAKDDLIQVSNSNDGTTMTFIYRIRDNEILRIYREEESYDPPNMLEEGFTPNDETIVLKAPLQVGTKWQADEAISEIVSVDASLSTPAGEFDSCIKVETIYPQAKAYSYYKEGVGLIKNEFVAGDMKVTATLKEYR